MRILNRRKQPDVDIYSEDESEYSSSEYSSSYDDEDESYESSDYSSSSSNSSDSESYSDSESEMKPLRGKGWKKPERKPFVSRFFSPPKFRRKQKQQDDEELEDRKAKKAAERLGKDLEMMGYNLDVTSYITKSTLGSNDRYNLPKDELSSTIDFRDELEALEDKYELREDADTKSDTYGSGILNMRSDEESQALLNSYQSGQSNLKSIHKIRKSKRSSSHEKKESESTEPTDKLPKKSKKKKHFEQPIIPSAVSDISIQEDINHVMIEGMSVVGQTKSDDSINQDKLIPATQLLLPVQEKVKAKKKKTRRKHKSPRAKNTKETAVVEEAVTKVPTKAVPKRRLKLLSRLRTKKDQSPTDVVDEPNDPPVQEVIPHEASFSQHSKAENSKASKAEESKALSSLSGTHYPVILEPPRRQNVAAGQGLRISTLEAESISTQERKTTQELLVMPPPQQMEERMRITQNVVDDSQEDIVQERSILCCHDPCWGLGPCSILGARQNEIAGTQHRGTNPEYDNRQQASTFNDEVPPPTKSASMRSASSAENIKITDTIPREEHNSQILSSTVEDAHKTQPQLQNDRNQTNRAIESPKKRRLFGFRRRRKPQKHLRAQEESRTQDGATSTENERIFPSEVTLHEKADPTVASIHSYHTREVVRIQPNGEVEFSRHPQQARPVVSSAKPSLEHMSGIKKQNTFSSAIPPPRTRAEFSTYQRKSNTELATSMGDFFRLLFDDPKRRSAAQPNNQNTPFSYEEANMETPRTMISIPSVRHASSNLSLAASLAEVVAEKSAVEVNRVPPMAPTDVKIPDELPKASTSRRSKEKSIANSTLPSLENSLPPPNSTLEKTPSGHFQIVAPLPESDPQHNLANKTIEAAAERPSREKTVKSQAKPANQRIIKITSSRKSEIVSEAIETKPSQKTKHSWREQKWDKKFEDDRSTKPELDLDQLIQQSRAKKKKTRGSRSDVSMRDSFLSLNDVPKKPMSITGPPIKTKTKGNTPRDPLQLTVEIPKEASHSRVPIDKGVAEKPSKKKKARTTKKKNDEQQEKDGIKTGPMWNIRSDGQRFGGDDPAATLSPTSATDEELLRMLSGISDQSHGNNPQNALKNLKKNAQRLGVRETDLLLAVRSSESQSFDVLSDNSVKSMTIGEEILDVLKTYFGEK